MARVTRPFSGFTLIELLAVMAIIGVLAGFTIGGMKGFKRRQYISNTQAEMAQLETAIQSYHNALGFYPPDHPGNAVINQLYYELSGTMYTNNLPPSGSPGFITLDGSAQITTDNVNSTFGVGGFINCSRPGAGEDASAARNFLPGLRLKQIGTATIGGVAVTNLVGSVGGPDANYSPLAALLPGVNPWRYVSSNPTNNPGAYDLWIQLSIAGKTNLICNWSKQIQINNPLP